MPQLRQEKGEGGKGKEVARQIEQEIALGDVAVAEAVDVDGTDGLKGGEVDVPCQVIGAVLGGCGQDAEEIPTESRIKKSEGQDQVQIQGKAEPQHTSDAAAYGFRCVRRLTLTRQPGAEIGGEAGEDGQNDPQQRRNGMIDLCQHIGDQVDEQ